MIPKHHKIEAEFHPRLTALLFILERQYRRWGSEMVVTSGSEQSTRHSRTSLHYAGAAVDLRTRRQRFEKAVAKVVNG